METTATFTINEVGEETGRTYDGKFVIKTILSRRDRFVADERRRLLIGTNPAAVAPALAGEAYMLGQLFVRIVEAPKWWTDSDTGLDLQDGNIIGALFRLSEEKVAEGQKDLQATAEKALEKMAKTGKKISAKEE